MRCKALAVSALTLVAGAADAQSSVVLYGIADAGFRYNSNDHGNRQYALASGGDKGSRWGLRGAEDLGDGLKGIFRLEGGFDIVNGKVGQNGTLFGREASVGLSSNTYGTLTFGRQTSTVTDALGSAIVDGGPWASPGSRYRAHPGDIDNLDNSNRINNAVVYKSPRLDGYQFAGLYSFGGVAGDTSRNQIYDFSANYTSGPLMFAAGYVYAKQPNYSFWGDKANDSQNGLNIKSPVASGYASAGSQQIVALGGAYATGPFTFGISYSNVLFRNLGTVDVAGLSPTASAYRGQVSFDVGEVNARYQLTPAMFLAATYSFTRNRGVEGQGGAHYHQVDLGTTYSLSKLTSLYLLGMYQRASGTDSTGAPAVAAINSVGPSSSNQQFVATTGITHKF
jgi:predicted porin